MSAACVEFDVSLQSVEALKEAAYRFLPFGTCNLQTEGTRIFCFLEPSDVECAEKELRQRFLTIVTDENVREKIENDVRPVRDLILALAFGALAEQA